MKGNAIDTLKEVVKKRKWHSGLIEVRKAAMYKTALKSGKMKQQTAEKILEILGWHKVKFEIWEKP